MTEVKSNKSTQNYKLFVLLKSAGATGVKKEYIAKELGVSLVSVPVYIHEIKRLFKADVKSIKNGRNVVAYALMNADKVKVNQFRRNAAGSVAKPPKVVVTKAEEVKVEDGSVPIPDKDLDIAVISDREMSDIRDSLGVSFGGTGWGSRGGDY
jgi:hypothetical protein